MNMGKYYLRKQMPKEKYEELSDFPEFIRELLYNRGIDDKNSAEEFLRPDYDAQLHDPFLFNDMRMAVDRALDAIDRKERIVVYSDFDADGIAAGTIFSDLFKKIGYTNFRNYIPHRHNEGYGLNEKAVEELVADGVSLLVTADCGVTDNNVIQLLVDHGVDVIVTDHHIPGEFLPPAVAILNPHCVNEGYPDKDLCGAGVAFKMCCAILWSGSFEVSEGWEKWLLDLVSMATIADMVPLRGENRVLVSFGLLVLSKTRRAGIVELFRRINMNQKEITEDDIGFMVAPRINAASRMDAPDKALKLLSTADIAEASDLAREIEKINDKRKGLVASMIKEIRSKIDEDFEYKDVVVTGNPNWRPALLGLAANSLVKEYGRTVFLWGREGNGCLKGSCRSDGSVDLSALMEEAGDAFLGYGGHKWAGGFSVSFESVHYLEKRLSSSYKKVAGKAVEGVPVEKILDLNSLNWENYRLIRRLAPFGEGNPKPLFLFKEVFVKDVQKFGQGKEHLRLELQDDFGRSISAITFFTNEDDLEKKPEKGSRVNVIASLERSTYGGEHLRLRVVDVV